MGAKTVIIPIPYSYIKAREVLPARSYVNLNIAALFYQKYREESLIVIVAPAFYAKEEIRAKKDYLIKLQVKPEDIVVTDASVSTFTDAEVAENKIRELGVEIKELILIPDKWHAPRVRLIFEDRFSGINIKLFSIDSLFEKDHPQFIQRRLITWAPACVVMYWLMRIFGVRSWVSKLAQPRSE